MKLENRNKTLGDVLHDAVKKIIQEEQDSELTL